MEPGVVGLAFLEGGEGVADGGGGGVLLVDERGGGDEGVDEFGDELVLGGVLAGGGVAEVAEDVADDFAGVAEAVAVTLKAVLEVAGEDGDDALVDVEVDVLALPRHLQHRQQQLR